MEMEIKEKVNNIFENAKLSREKISDLSIMSSPLS